MRPALLPLAAATVLASAHGFADPHSYANLDEVRVSHLHLDVKADFERRQLSGFVDLTLDWRDPAARRVVLDSRALAIHTVHAIAADGTVRRVRHRLGPNDPILGQALSITLPAQVPKLRIRYRTSPRASGLQWLSPAQTRDHRHPYLFSQSQAIHARSWIPLMDSPAVRYTYSARVQTPPDLRALMSAVNDPEAPKTGDYRFVMPQPIPSYLMAIAVGDVVFQSLGPRSGVWTEPSGLAAAAAELVDTERMIDIAEQLYGPYRWGRYDLLVLPPSFPFGGMENPRLTFLTPTFIAGDRSLVSLIAHELAHSWSGNLVTNATWDSFWLNEGFTSYVENRIVEAAFDRERAVMEQALSVDGLQSELKTLAPADQKLRLNLKGRDPDDGMSAIAYDKGQWLLRFIEARVGREVFDPFLRGWFDAHAFQSVTTDDFLAYLDRELLAKHPGKLTRAEVAAFVEQPGIPDFAPRPESMRFAQVDLSIRAYAKTEAAPDSLPTANWTAQEWLRFLNGLPRDLPVARVEALDRAHRLTGTGNNEVAHAFYRLALATGYRGADAAIEAYLSRIGRRKLIVPIYQDLMQTPAGRERAQRIYAAARPGYHPITQATLDGIVGVR
jgi:aminopeptidase N